MGNHNVIISVKEGADPAAGRVVTEHDGNRTIVVTSDPASIVATAVEAVDEGAGRIELCGALGPRWQAKVIEAVGHQVQVGAVMFGFESITGVADYKARFGHEFLQAALLYLQPGADPAVDRTVMERADERAFLVAVPDAATAAAVAVQLVDGDGVQLIEMYGGFEPADAARVIDAIDTRAPVGLASYGTPARIH